MLQGICLEANHSSSILIGFLPPCLCRGHHPTREVSASGEYRCGYVLVITALAAIVALAIILILAMLIVPVLVTSATLAITMLLLVTRNIFVVIPFVLHKEDTLAAGVVFAAVLAPMFGVARWYAQINRWTIIRYTPLDYSRLTIDHLWLRKVTDVYLAIEAGLAYADRDSNIRSECRCVDGDNGYRRCNQ